MASVAADTAVMRVLFVAEQFVPPIFNGSTLVYDLWLRMLNRFCEPSAVLFCAEGEPVQATHEALSRLCRDYLILPGHSRSRVLKVARAAGRFVTGSIFAPAWLEEAHRQPIHRQVADFMRRCNPDVLVLSKLETLHLFGRDLVRQFQGTRILDLHDDFVAREGLMRKVMVDLRAEHKSLAAHASFRRALFRQRLSRFDRAVARHQERSMLSHFDKIFVSSHEEYRSYAADPVIGPRCVHAPWPVRSAHTRRRDRSQRAFDAGFIGSDAPFNIEALAHFCRHVLPVVRQARPAFQLLVVGAVSAAFAKTGPVPAGVTLEDAVANVTDFYDRISLSVVPLLSGTGVSLKTLEALQCGCRVLATPAGARGLESEQMAGLTVVSGADSFAAELLRLLASGEAGADFGPVSAVDPLESYHRLFMRSVRAIQTVIDQSCRPELELAK